MAEATDPGLWSADFGLDLQGRLRNVRLSPARALVPLFEALVNALHSVEERGGTARTITIHILREPVQQELSLEDLSRFSVQGFRISDDGLGFTDGNMKSFRTSDSTFKSRLGGRGVGRFTWLKVFEEAFIDSIFQGSDGTFLRRSFRFSEKGITDLKQERLDGTPSPLTQITLRNPRKEYAGHIPKKRETIAQRLVEHCFMSIRACQTKLDLRLYDGDDCVDLRESVDEVFSNAKKDIFQLDGQRFHITHLSIRSSETIGNRLSWLANGREVLSEALSREIPLLRQRLGSDGAEFWWLSLVESPFLDQHVTSERDGFLFPPIPDPLFPDQPSLEALRTKAIEAIRKTVEPYLEPLRAESVSRVESFVSTRAPEYRHLLKIRPQAIEVIPADISDEKLDLELHKVAFTVESELRQQGHELLKSERIELSKYDEFLSETNALGKANLAKYVVHRRTILDLFRRSLGLNSDHAYELEEAVHRLIFPLRTTSAEVPYEQLNLWIIDERLAYHSYLASDKPFSTVDIATVDGRERPDLLVFGNPFAFSDGQPPFGSVVIVEFKRPARNNYTNEENPISQVYGYVRRVRNGTAKDRAGRPVNIPEHMPFYCYIICDLTERLKEHAQNASLIETPDSMGFFGFNANLRTYVEVVSFDKLLNDAEKRNRVLFDKLNLPK